MRRHEKVPGVAPVRREGGPLARRRPAMDVFGDRSDVWDITVRMSEPSRARPEQNR